MAKRFDSGDTLFYDGPIPETTTIYFSWGNWTISFVDDDDDAIDLAPGDWRWEEARQLLGDGK